MTLYKQLVIGMIAVFMLLMTSVFVIEFRSTQDFLVNQQESEINNTINTVGLALAPYLKEKDPVAVESVINALFDGSSYSVVRLIFLDNNEEILRSYPIAPPSVPQWFIDLNIFSKLHDKRVITSGWMQLAEVEIVSHPGEAYYQLWQTFVRLLGAFGVLLLLGLGAIAFIVKRSLQPLQAIRKKMEDVANNQFGEPLTPPKTKDLVILVEGINMMSNQVEASFKAQAREAQQLRERAYMDPVSQLGNRSFFMSQLNQWLGESAQGGIAILEAHFIKELYEKRGYEAGDNMVQELAQELSNGLTTPDLSIARISSDEFGFIAPNLEEDEIKILSENILNYAQTIQSDPLGVSSPEVYLGVVANKEKKPSSEILALVDNALTQAKSTPENPVTIISAETSHNSRGKQQWKSLVEEAIHNDWFAFRFQSANDSQSKTFHAEVFTAIEKDGERYTANQFLFALEQLKSTHIFDQYVIEKMLEKLSSGEITTPIAVNIAQSSIEQPSFIRWVGQVLSRYSNVADKLHFEIPEPCFIKMPHYTALLCNTIRSANAAFGVDNYGRNFQSLEYLNEYRPTYVKLDYLYTHQLEDEKQKYTLSSISRTAHNLGITTIASRVETQTQLELLSEHFVDVFQGFIVDR
ncbi:EAL domain-containing protein [Vibrio maerlii]|uniref:bifunctional diguanylate cyclase/phosphodiesterase n=1 Tax=Vibrio maerlii TaxID=2231648 RepID=UPI000E3C9A31|nr:EAL domain-containing protein [Vibrio maerlii]